jgi:hypothetical protein
LSDYTNRKKKTNAAQQQAAQASPLAVTTSTSGGVLQKDSIKEEKEETPSTAVLTAAPSSAGFISSPTMSAGKLAIDKTSSPSIAEQENHNPIAPSAVAPTQSTAMEIDSTPPVSAGEARPKPQGRWGAW